MFFCGFKDIVWKPFKTCWIKRIKKINKSDPKRQWWQMICDLYLHLCICPSWYLNNHVKDVL